MKIKPCAIGLLSIFTVWQIYANAEVMTRVEDKSQKGSLTANIQQNGTGDSSNMVTGIGADGKTHSATIDVNGRWQSPTSNSQVIASEAVNDVNTIPDEKINK